MVDRKGGFLNLLESNEKAKRELDARMRTALENLASVAIDQLALAREA